MVNNTSKIERIGVKEKPSAWEGLILITSNSTTDLQMQYYLTS